MTTTYTIEKTETGYIVTDGIWASATYTTRAIARKVLRDASWGERGADGRGTHTTARLNA